MAPLGVVRAGVVVGGRPHRLTPPTGVGETLGSLPLSSQTFDLSSIEEGTASNPALTKHPLLLRNTLQKR